MRRTNSLARFAALLAVALGACATVSSQSPEKPGPATPSPGKPAQNTLEITRKESLAGKPAQIQSTAIPREPLAGKYLEVAAGTTIPVALAHTLTTRTARMGDFVTFKTMAPVHSEDRQLAIPAESMVRGTLAGVKRPGRVRGKAELRIHLERVSLPNGYTLELNASLEPPGPEHPGDKEGGTIAGESGKAHDAITVATFGGQGAVLGSVAGQSARDAAVGAGAGALAGLIGVLLSRGPEIRLELGTPFRVTLSRPLRVDLDELRALPEVLQPISDRAPRLKHNSPVATPPDKP